jgi:hypothetical protein
MGLLYGRAGRLTPKNGGFWPGQSGAGRGAATPDSPSPSRDLAQAFDSIDFAAREPAAGETARFEETRREVRLEQFCAGFKAVQPVCLERFRTVIQRSELL